MSCYIRKPPYGDELKLLQMAARGELSSNRIPLPPLLTAGEMKRRKNVARHVIDPDGSLFHVNWPSLKAKLDRLEAGANQNGDSFHQARQKWSNFGGGAYGFTSTTSSTTGSATTSFSSGAPFGIFFIRRKL